MVVWTVNGYLLSVHKLVLKCLQHSKHFLLALLGHKTPQHNASSFTAINVVLQESVELVHYLCSFYSQSCRILTISNMIVKASE